MNRDMVFRSICVNWR